MDFIAGCLRVDPPSNLGTTLRLIADSGILDWSAVAEIAHSELIAPAFWSALSRRGLAALVPDEIGEDFRKAHLLTALRNKQFKEQALHIARELNALGVQPTFLKGGASLFVSPYDDQGCRFMADLDILVPADRAGDCWDAIKGMGYAPIELEFEFDHSMHHHLRPLHSESKVGSIEVHHALLGNPATKVVPEEFVHRHLEQVHESGASLNVPDPTLRILHVLLHSGVVDRDYAYGSMCLRALHELAIMQAVFSARIDWVSIRDLMTRGGMRRVLEAFAYRAHRTFGSSLPDAITQTPRAVIHYRRTRLQAGSPALERLVLLGMSFSRESICERYRCDDDFLSVAAGRLRHAVNLARHSLSAGASKLMRFSRRSTTPDSAT